ncbi:hypothetical protein L6164_033186 [Bauhinia variegata]|uniref:Uncharacterized protein n=1 Tax=Bauhinia variegata TaxID=167791 RepID=A0ACB9KR75_BAUVA|nr:hypothetical protein L6164_033186 [Bauhinia variegata]
MAEIMNLQFYYISEDKLAESIDSTLVPNAAYLTIKSIVTCSWQIASIMSFRQEYISPSREALELSNLVSKVNSIHHQLKNQLDTCYQDIGKEIILQFLTYSDEDLQIDTIGSNETRVNMGSQRRKHVLLLISDLNNISEEEIKVLDNLYKEQAMQSDEKLYEMVWIPVVEKRSRSYLNERKFGELKSIMPWHSVRYSLIDPARIIQIKEKLNFTGKPVLLVRDPQGRVTSTNVIHLMWIWGNLAFPFTREREEDLWSNQIWSLRTIIDPIDATTMEWISEDNHICLYGGSNLEWIRTFTKAMTEVARAANIKLKMVYVGECNTKEETQKMAAAIAKENLSYVLPNNSSLWLFWARLESMQYSKLQQNKTADNDEFMRELTTLLNYDGDEGWAMICGGEAGEMAKDNGPNILRALNLFVYWEDDVLRGFETALMEFLGKLPSIEHCNRLILPFEESLRGIAVRCAECGLLMEKHFLFRCVKGE